MKQSGTTPQIFPAMLSSDAVMIGRKVLAIVAQTYPHSYTLAFSLRWFVTPRLRGYVLGACLALALGLRYDVV